MLDLNTTELIPAFLEKNKMPNFDHSLWLFFYAQAISMLSSLRKFKIIFDKWYLLISFNCKHRKKIETKRKYKNKKKVAKTRKNRSVLLCSWPLHLVNSMNIIVTHCIVAIFKAITALWWCVNLGNLREFERISCFSLSFFLL